MILSSSEVKPEIVEILPDNKTLVNEYLNFIQWVFPGAKFLEWWEKGFWTDKYKPFSILESGKIISNVTAALMDVIINGQTYTAIQIGAVGTIPEFRNKGLSRVLMEYVLNRYADEADLFFLFANDSVLEFYPKFDFIKIKEKIFLLDHHLPEIRYSARKLNLQHLNDYKLLLDLINKRNEITTIFGAGNYGSITMWHIFNNYKNNLFYLEEEDAIIIKTEKRNEMFIREIIFREPFEMLPALSKIIESDEIKRICFYFPPDKLSYPYDTAAEYKSHLFIRSKIELNQDLLKFPETAKT